MAEKIKLSDDEIYLLERIKYLQLKIRNGGVSHNEYNELEYLRNTLQEESNNLINLR